MELEALTGIAGAAFLGFFLCLSLKAIVHVCPECREKFILNRHNRNRIRFGHLPCPKCGTMIEVDF